MNRQRKLIVFGILLGIIILAVGSCLYAASWDSFKTAQLSGISLDKPLQTNCLDYILTVGQNPTITIGSRTYKVNWIQSFYVVSGTQNRTFTAEDGLGSENWTWDSKAKNGQISGWTGQGNNRLDPGDTMKFSFMSFDTKGNPVTTGFHISYQVGKNSNTDWFKVGTLNSISTPEPASLITLGAAVVGLFIVMWRRKAQRVL